MYINSDTVLCPGTYYLNDVDTNGVIIINASNITLDCNGTVLNGNRTGGSVGISNGYLNKRSGVITKNSYSDVTVKNCIIEDYFIGLFWINATGGSVENNNISNSVRTGIDSYYSFNNTYTNNKVINTNGGAYYDGSYFSHFAGIEIRYSDHFDLIGNIAEDNKYGIFVGQDSEYANLINNTVIQNIYGIGILLMDHVTLSNNIANYNYDIGFAVVESSYIDFYSNEAVNNTVGFGLQTNHSNLVNNKVSGGYGGIGLISGTRNTSLVGEILKNISISENITHNPHPPEFCYNISLINNTADGANILPWYYPSGFGLVIEECNNIILNENSADSNAFSGIVVLDSLETSIGYNNASDNDGYGIYSESSQSITIESNEILENQDEGIKIYDSHYEGINLNNIGFNKIGIYMIDSTGWDIINNTVYNNTDGDIIVDPSQDIRIIDNTISGSTYGIQLIEINNTEVSKNLVEFNDIGAFVANSSNFGMIDNVFRNNTQSNIIIDPCNDFSVIDNEISYSDYGLKLLDSTNGFLLRNSFQYNGYGIVNIDSSGISTNDSVITDSVYSDILLENSDNVMTNTTFDIEKVNITGPSEMSVKWHFDARILEEGCQNPLENAIVVGYDNFNNLVFNATTNAGGELPIQELLEYVQNSTEKLFYTPYVIKAEKGDYVKEIVILDINQSTYLDIFLAVNITSSNINIDPDVINLGSNGKFIKAFIEIPGYDVSEIDINTVRINKAIPAINDTKYGFVTSPTIEDTDSDGLLEYMAVFYRSEVMEILEVGNNTLSVTGLVGEDGFAGSDIVNVIG